MKVFSSNFVDVVENRQYGRAVHKVFSDKFYFPPIHKTFLIRKFPAIR